MSDVFGLTLYFHVFTPDGDLSVSDSSEGDQVLQALVAQYPDATVIPKDRDTGEPLAEEMPLLRLLQRERGLISIEARPGAKR
jgi:hypothetical protein